LYECEDEDNEYNNEEDASDSDGMEEYEDMDG
jgi:hypothetical protein